MKVYFVGAGPGDPELLTVKARRLLERCRVCVYAGSLVSPEVVGLLPVDAEKHDSAGMNLEEITAVFTRARDADRDVVRLHSGDPSIYGAIREQMNALDREGIEYEVIPGVSSFQAAAAALRTELTAPEVSQTVILTRTAGRTPVPDHQDLATLGASRGTLCIFLSVRGIADAADALKGSYGSDCPAAVVYRASWPDQKIIRGTLADIAEKTETEGVTKTAMIVVGWALGREGPASKLYDPKFSHGRREGGGS